MISTFAGLNTAVRGLNSQQIGLDTLGHNISNVNTEGYSRQAVNLATTNSQSYTGLHGPVEVGTGVGVNSIMRKRDTFMDRQYWKANSTRAYSTTMKDSLEKIEGIFQEPSDTGLQTVFNKFWNSLQTLSTNAADYATRANAKACGDDVVNAIQLAGKQIKNNISDLNSVVDLKVASFNQMSSEVCALNKQIVFIEGTGDNANDLRDRRDNLIDKMSDLTKITATEDKFGSYTVQINGNEIVNGDSYIKLESRSVMDKDYDYEVRYIGIEGIEDNLKFGDGEFQAILESRDDETIGNKRYLNELSKLSKYFLTEFNAIHRAGMGTDNSTNNNFFGSMLAGSGADFDFVKGGSMINPLTGKTEVSNPGAWKKGDWLNALCINEAFQTTEGLSKISAKTSLNSSIIAKVNAPLITTNGKFSGTGDVIAHLEEVTLDTTPIEADTTTIPTATTPPADKNDYEKSGKKPITAIVGMDANGNYVVDYGGTTKAPATYNAANGELKFTVNGVAMKFIVDDPMAYKYELKENAVVGDKATATLKNDAKKYTVTYKDGAGTTLGKNEAVYYDGNLSFSYMGLTVKSKVGKNPTEFNYTFSDKNPLKARAVDKNGIEVNTDSKITITAIGAYTGAENSTNVVFKRDAAGNYTYKIGDDPEERIAAADIPPDKKIVLKNVNGLEVTLDLKDVKSGGTYEFVLTKNNNASGDNAVNLANLMKSGEVEILGNQSLEAHYAVLISDLSISSQNAERLMDNQDALVLQLDNWRQAVCGVSIDEEMSDMIRYQRGYGAASRVINTMDEMLEKLINSTGMVGR